MCALEAREKDISVVKIGYNKGLNENLSYKDIKMRHVLDVLRRKKEVV